MLPVKDHASAMFKDYHGQTVNKSRYSHYKPQTPVHHKPDAG